MAEELEGNAFYSTNLTTETPIVIDDLIYSLEPKDLPLLTGMGSSGVPLLQRSPTGDTTFYWMEERAPLPRSTVSGAINSSVTTITVPTAGAVNFSIGDTIKIESELILVTDIDTSAETLTVTRGYAGTSGASHADGSAIIGVGTILPEGDVGNSNFVGRDKYSNYTQIWSKTLRVSGTEQVIRKYGIPNELNHQMVKQSQNLYLGMEHSALYGVKYVDTATRKRSSGGIMSWITATVDSTTAWITVSNIEAQQSAAYALGGEFTHVMVHPNGMAALNNGEGSERISTVTVDDPRRGRRPCSMVNTEFGPVELVRHRWLKTTDAVGYSPDRFTMRTLRPMMVEKLAKVDDTDSFLLICEAGFMLKGQAHCVKWTGLNTSAALPAVLT